MDGKPDIDWIEGEIDGLRAILYYMEQDCIMAEPEDYEGYTKEEIEEAEQERLEYVQVVGDEIDDLVEKALSLQTHIRKYTM